MSSTAYELDQIEETGARAQFLQLRRVVGLPDGGEVTLKEEIRKVAEEMDVPVQDDWTRERLMYEMMDTYYARREGGRDGMPWSWEEYDRGTTDRGARIARDFGYMSSGEAGMLADHIVQRRERVDEWIWGGDE